MLKISDEIFKSLDLRLQDKVNALGITYVGIEYDLLIYCGYRSLEEQNKLFCSSRRVDQIQLKVDSLRAQKYPKLAQQLLMVANKILDDYDSRKQQRPLVKAVTNAAGGESYHNYGLAFDAVPVLYGKALWDDQKKYKEYGSYVSLLGLEWAGLWVSFKEYPHAQLKGLALSNLMIKLEGSL